MARIITMAVAFVLALVGLFGFATGDFVGIGCVVIVLSSLVFAVMLGIGGGEEDET